MTLRVVAAALLVALAAEVRAGEGVREINQASVSGDATALHIISAPGSYRLTGDLLVPDTLDGIRIDVGDVTIDLNGFTISSQSLVGLAIHGITGASLTNVEIRNGTIRGFPTSGVHLPGGQLHRVIDVRVIGNGNFGINIEAMGTSGGVLVRGCTALGNGSGIRLTPDGSLLLDSVARSNTNLGLILGTTVGYGRNASTNNGTTDVSGGIPVDCNVIGGSPVCPP